MAEIKHRKATQSKSGASSVEAYEALQSLEDNCEILADAREKLGDAPEVIYDEL
jgi:hypothetical protein